MIDEHTREDELEIQIIGLQGKVERLDRERQELIGEFRTIRDRILLQMREKYGYTAKGNKYLESLFKEEFKKWSK